MFRHEQAGKPPRWLEQTRESAHRIKQQQAAESDRRMMEFEVIEAKRVAQLLQAKSEQENKDRQLLLGGLAIGVFIAGLLILAALL
jgi:hypothetical protein